MPAIDAATFRQVFAHMGQAGRKKENRNKSKRFNKPEIKVKGFLPILRLGAASVPFYQIESVITCKIYFFCETYIFLKGFVAQHT